MATIKSIEEKAKRYDEALVRATIWQNHLFECDDKDYAEELNYIFPELKESEDERIRKHLISSYQNMYNENPDSTCDDMPVKDILAWLEKQGEHKKFRDSIQVGDKVTKNEDGVLVNLSQLKRVAKKDENQGEQKPAWSDEDENRINRLIAYFEDKESFTAEDDVVYANWLKSLRPPYYCDNCKLKKSIQGWKPSDEQIFELECVVKQNKDNMLGKNLQSLLDDLKKLKEE